MADHKVWCVLRQNSRDHLEPFEPKWSAREFDRKAFSKRVKRAEQQARAGTDYTFLIFEKKTKSQTLLVGGLTLSNVRYAVACHANLGYWMGAQFAGRGTMSRAVNLACNFAFDELRLNRLQAAILPQNIASRRVLEKNSFIEEGFCEHYLKINGHWEDHVLFGLSRARRDADAILNQRL